MKPRQPAAPYPLAERFLLPVLLVLLALSPAKGQVIYLLTESGSLAKYSITLGTLTSPSPLAGVEAGDQLVAMDVRPNNQRLYALGVNTSAGTLRLYHISPETLQATPLGSPGQFSQNDGSPLTIPTTRWDMDFNPASDRIRVVSESGLNFRMNPNEGSLIDGSGGSPGIQPDPDTNGGPMGLGGAAFTNNAPSASITTLYTVDPVSGSLFIQTPLNSGAQSSQQTITLNGSPLGFTNASLDILPGVNAPSSGAPVTSGVGYLVAGPNPASADSSSLYSLNLVTGAATLLNAFTFAVRSSALQTELGVAYVLLDGSLQFVRFDPTSPTTLTTISLSGITFGETLRGITRRPATGQLIALGVNSGSSTATVYRLDPQTGALTAIGTPSQIALVDSDGASLPLTTSGDSLGLSVDPATDQLVVANDAGLNFRINLSSGLPVDGDLASPGINPNSAITLNGTASGALALAFTNSYAQPPGSDGPRTLYTLASPSLSLCIQSPQESGVLSSPLPLQIGLPPPISLYARMGMDIPSSLSVQTNGASAQGQAWFLISVNDEARIFRMTIGQVAESTGFLGTGAQAGRSLALWSAPPTIEVEAPPGTEIQSGVGTQDLGDVAVGGTLLFSLRLSNVGTHPLEYTASTATAGPISIAEGSSGSIAGSANTTLTLAVDTTTSGSFSDNLTISSNDPSRPAFQVAVSARVLPVLVRDSATVTNGATTIYPLANDGLGETATILSVSDPSLQISGRSIIIPQGFSGNFTYLVDTGGILPEQGAVSVLSGDADATSRNYNGLLRTADGLVVGWAKASVTTRGVTSLQLKSGVRIARATLKIPSQGIGVSSPTKLGPVVVTRLSNNLVTVKLTEGNSTYTGTLKPLRSSSTRITQHVALESIETAFLGGGYLTEKTSAKGLVTIAGVLPDGLRFTSSTGVADNNTVAFLAKVASAKPPGFVAGEVVRANLPASDLTGELRWSKPDQIRAALHSGGVETVLTANGALFQPGVSVLSGSGVLLLSGGNLVSQQSTAALFSSSGVPTDSSNVPLLRWKAARNGTFTAKVSQPGFTKPVTGKGLYIPKAKRAWGFFPGSDSGGRIDLQQN